MMYLLSEAEFEELGKRADLALIKYRERIQRLCSLVADNMPVPVPRAYKEDGPPEPWGCRLTAGGKNHGGYCDRCPVKDDCPHGGKRWSK